MTRTDVYGNYLRYGAKTRPKARGVHEIDITKGLITGFRGRENAVPEGYCTRMLNTVPRNDGSYAARPPIFVGPSFGAGSMEDGSIYASAVVGTFSDGGIMSVNDAFTGFNFQRVWRTGFTANTVASTHRHQYGNAAHYGNVSVVPAVEYDGGDENNADVVALVVTFNPTALTMTVTQSNLTTTFGHAAYVYQDASLADSAYSRVFALSWKGRTFILAGAGISYSGPLQPGVFTTASGGGFIPLDTTAPITGAFVLQDVLYIATESELFAMTYNTDPGRDRNIRTHTKVAIFGAAEYDNIGYFATQQGLYRIIAGQLAATFIPSDQNYANPKLTGDTGNQAYPLGTDSVFIPRIAGIHKIGDSILIAGLGFNADQRFGDPSGLDYVYPVFNASTETWTEWSRPGVSAGIFSPVNALPIFQGPNTPNLGFPYSVVMQMYDNNLTIATTSPSQAKMGFLNSQPFNGFHFGFESTILNLNNTFETNVANWTPEADVTIAQSNTQAKKGTFSMRMTMGATPNNTRVMSSTTPCEEGEFFQFDCWLFNPNASSNATVGLIAEDGIGGEEQIGNVSKSIPQNVWTYVRAEGFVRDPDSVTIRGKIDFPFGTVGQLFYADEAYLRRGFIISPYCDVILGSGQPGDVTGEHVTIAGISAYEVLCQTGRLNFGSPVTWKRMHRSWMEVSLPGERMRSFDNPIWWSFFTPFYEEGDGSVIFREQEHRRIGRWHDRSDTFHNQTPGFHTTQDEEALLPSWLYDYLVVTHYPIMWFKMDETAGAVATDSSGNGFNGSIGSDITKNQPGLITEGTSFKTGSTPGSDNNYAVRNVSSPLNGSDRFSVGIWCKFSDTPGEYNFDLLWSIGTADWSWGYVGVQGDFPNIKLSSHFNPDLGDTPDLDVQLSSTELGAVPGTVFVVFTYNQGEHSLYVNGQLMASGIQPPATPTVINDCRQFLVGGWTQTEVSANIQDTIDDTFVDDAWVLGKALNPDEVWALYAAGLGDDVAPTSEVNFNSRFTSAQLEFFWQYPLEEANSLDLTNLPKFDEVGIGRLFVDVSEYKASNVGI